MRSLKKKLLVTILPLCLLPLAAISYFSYYQARERITEDRIILYLEQIAQGVADTIKLTLLEKKEETEAMALQLGDSLLLGASETIIADRPKTEKLLNELVRIHEVYDLLIVFDVEGQALISSSLHRYRIQRRLDAAELARLRGVQLIDWTPNADWLQMVRAGRFGYIDWHSSRLVQPFYDYQEQDIARRHNIAFAAPVYDSRGIVAGGLLALMNWEFIQDILDNVEIEFENRSLKSGYAFLFGADDDTIIAHKIRQNREYRPTETLQPGLVSNNYATSLRRDHNLGGLADAVALLQPDSEARPTSHYSYEYPPGTDKISGLAPIDHDYFRWVCGVGINDVDIFAPVQDLANILILATLLSSALVVLLTFSVARQITTPLNKLTIGAGIIAGGDLSQRVEVSSRDEIGELATKFNEMAASLEERSQALIDLNRQLEQKVEERTRELRESHAETEKAYQELKDTQVQLVQSEKMASLGQLVAGIAHEIKNPLNFIYGNTDFLKKYLGHLRELIQIYSRGRVDPMTSEEVERYKEAINYDFVQRDLDPLIANLEEGAKRIHDIIGDLRAFSRMDTDELQPIDIHEPIELALNLIRHEYRDRILIHREYGTLPRVLCHSGKLSQVFMNLLANACQAIPGNGDIWIRSRRVDGSVQVEIQDNGDGIDQQHVNRIFEPFFTTKPVGQGTGLGLSISYGIIQQHNGKITVESKPGKGTRFQITLPVHDEERKTAHPDR